MPCYRLVFQNQEAYCVDVERLPPVDGAPATYVGVIYGVHHDRRDADPITRADGQPMVAVGANPKAALATATTALAKLSGSALDCFVQC